MPYLSVFSTFNMNEIDCKVSSFVPQIIIYMYNVHVERNFNNPTLEKYIFQCI